MKKETIALIIRVLIAALSAAVGGLGLSACAGGDIGGGTLTAAVAFVISAIATGGGANGMSPQVA